eukprot:CAMPEP_0170475418 /NCGR_PEP_ID=MMETSP0123-20130129/17069_1 /TAXON_ID=182087 /ORGANISM="Favella ehrenbergii, Strain Fehren 1" /LENGTH=183 /DNA_ID=CAMNT_0010745909 /DNA_START=68 /DNA_END=616 /DNA_ORIENTATION=-
MLCGPALVLGQENCGCNKTACERFGGVPPYKKVKKTALGESQLTALTAVLNAAGASLLPTPFESATLSARWTDRRYLARMTSQEQIKESPSIDLQATSEADSSEVEPCEGDSQCSNSKTVTFEAESDEDAEYADGIDYSLTGSEKSDKMTKNGHFCGPDGAHKNCLAAENASGDSPHSGCYKW